MDNKELLIFNKSLEEKVAVMRESNLNYLLNFLKKHQYLKEILEIGTGCGYSSYCLSKLNSITKITTLEKDLKRFQIAQTFLSTISKIKVINIDAINFIETTKNKYDVIIIDGPKKHNLSILQKALTLINSNGICVIDNFYLKDLHSRYKNTKEKRLKTILENNNFLQNYVNHLDKKRYNLFIDTSGDGLVIIESIK